MFNISLKIFYKGENRLILAPTALFRIGFALIFGILLAGIGTNPGGTVPVPGIIIMAVSLLAVFYEERWIFDRDEEMIEYRTGLLFLSRKRRYRFSDVESFTFLTLQRGKVINANDETAQRGARYTLFGLRTLEGEKRSIEMIKSRLAPGLLEKAEQVARFCQISLEKEQPHG